jgi:flavine halogenase
MKIDKTGWAWCIPLHNGTHSIGIVMHEQTSRIKKASGAGGLEAHYMEQLELAPGVKGLIGENGKFVAGSTRSTSDYSYHATGYCGDHYRLIGDAAGTFICTRGKGQNTDADAFMQAFVDPLFSSGVHLAMTGALSAASTILGSMKGEVSEAEAQAWHDAKIGICQTRLVFLVD